MDIYDLDEKKFQSYRLNNTTQFPYPTFDWSADENWLVIPEDRALHLVAPAYEYQQIIFHDLNGCNLVAWINR